MTTFAVSIYYMRADRLIALLLLLQRKEKVTAAEVANELEVSLKTARRDLEALLLSGVPIYSQPGRNGGWRLIGGAKTNVSGLSSAEAQAVFLAAGSTAEQNPALQSALQKLLSAIPEPFQPEARTAAEAIKVDPTGWGQVNSPTKPKFLDELTSAVVSQRKVKLGYFDREGNESSRTIDPLGLVTKRNVWYLVANTTKGMRTFRVRRVADVEVLTGPITRPPDFDLEHEWNQIRSAVEEKRVLFTVDALVEPSTLKPLRWLFGPLLTVINEDNSDGQRRMRVKLGGREMTSFAGQVAGFGRRVTLLNPPAEVTRELARIGTELAEIYATQRA